MDRKAPEKRPNEEKNIQQRSRAGIPAQTEKPGKPAVPQRWEVTHKRIVTRSRVAMLVLVALLAALVVRLAVLQLADPAHYAEAAVDQYTYEVTLEAKRGTIYAADGKTKLAVSATTQTVFISPHDVYKAATEGTVEEPAPGEAAQIRMIADGLAKCLDDFDPYTLIKKYEDLGSDKLKYKYLVVKKDISEAEEAKVRAFISENKLRLQIALEEGTKRYYPYGTLASHLLGFVGSDNTGLGGIEYTYNSDLSGINGRAVRAQDANGNELAYNYETYEKAQDGLNLVTTIDWTVQSILDKYLELTYQQHKPEGRVSGIVMDVDTGEVLGYGIYPNFDLNHYATLSEPYQKMLDAYTGEDKDSYRSTLMNQMWNNTIASQTYEPGSTFKIITAAMALESGSITPTQQFNCGYAINVSGQTIHCWKRGDHGMQTVAEALVNSCNPALARIGHAVGTVTFRKYFEEFGYTAKTGTDIPGEVSSIYYATTGAQFRELELAVYSFGQTFKVTMLQHLAALSSVANGGYLVTPHIGKYLTDENGSVVKTFSTEPVRQIVSKDVCDSIMSYLINSTPNANVEGYNVVSKTGTSEKRDTKREDDYISSCVTFAPAEDPRIAVLITVDTPTAGEYYGSQVAAPAVKRILTEVLPYLGISPSQQESAVEMKLISNYIGSRTEDAKAAIEALGLKCVIKGDGETVNEQLPRADQRVAVGGTVILYTGNAQPEASVSVPDVRQSSPKAAIRSLQAKGLNVRLEGITGTDTEAYYVSEQSVAPGEHVEPGTLIILQCLYKTGQY